MEPDCSIKTSPRYKWKYGFIFILVFFFTLVLLGANYFSQLKLREYSVERLRLQVRGDASVLSYFYSERLEDLSGLASSREIRTYFENKALGMSEEYGLRASLSSIGNAFDRLAREKKIGDRTYYTRISFVDHTGNPLVDRVYSGGANDVPNWMSFIDGPPEKSDFLGWQDHGPLMVVISMPYVFKSVYKGQILAWISPGVAQEYIFRDRLKISGSTMELCTGSSCIHGIGIEDKDENTSVFDRSSPVMVFTSHIKGTPFNLVTRIRRSDVMDEWSPGRTLATMGGISLAFMLGFALLLRMNTRNLVLHTRLEDESRTKREMEEKNRQLEDEIARRIRVQDALSESEKSYRLLAENVEDVIVTLDMKRCFSYVSPSVEGMTGFDPREMKGRSFSQCIVPGYVERVMDVLDLKIIEKSYGKRKHSTTIEFELCRSDGPVVWIEAAFNLLMDKDENAYGFLGVMRDISRRKRTEIELENYRKNLEMMVENRTAELKDAVADLQAAQSKLIQSEKMASIGQLAAGVAHEINNPMGFITSNLETMGKYSARLLEFIDQQGRTLSESAADREPIDNIRKKLKIDYISEDINDLVSESLDGAERVKKIVYDLKSFSRIDETGVRSADINECIETTLNIVWNELKYKATIEKDYGNIPQIVCCPQQLNQVFMNLLVNAGQAIEKQGMISIKTFLEDSFVSVCVTDTGCGISPGKMDRIFEPFFTTKEIGEGTGLGLSIAYDIVKKHNGEINVCSTPGAGTTFTVSLPVECRMEEMS